MSAFTDREVAIVKGMLRRGDRQHDIAAYFGVNGGRVAEVKTGAHGAGIEVADERDLPPPGPYMPGRAAIRLRDTVIAQRDLLNEVLRDLESIAGRTEASDVD